MSFCFDEVFCQSTTVFNIGFLYDLQLFKIISFNTNCHKIKKPHLNQSVKPKQGGIKLYQIEDVS